MMEASGYSLDLYCDNGDVDHGFDAFPWQFTGSDRGCCTRKACHAGWLFKRDGRHLCPRCSGKPGHGVRATCDD